jgi:hypothetical protein
MGAHGCPLSMFQSTHTAQWVPNHYYGLLVATHVLSHHPNTPLVVLSPSLLLWLYILLGNSCHPLLDTHIHQFLSDDELWKCKNRFSTLSKDTTYIHTFLLWLEFGLTLTKMFCATHHWRVCNTILHSSLLHTYSTHNNNIFWHIWITFGQPWIKPQHQPPTAMDSEVNTVHVVRPHTHFTQAYWHKYCNMGCGNSSIVAVCYTDSKNLLTCVAF